jgi:hypothetical protein
MSILEMSEEEKKKILEKHTKAINDFKQKKEDLKVGLKKPEEKKK